MTKFRVRLALIFIALIGLSVLAAGMYAAKMLEDSHLSELKSNMLREMRIILATTAWPADSTQAEQMHYLQSKAMDLQRYAGARITFIDADGTVLGDSDSDPSHMDNHLDREEIIAAQVHGEGDSIRYSDTIKRNMLYVAVRVQDDRGVIGFIRLSMSLEDAESSVRKLWSGLAAGLLVLFVIAGTISYRLSLGLTRPIEKMTKVAGDITRMNYSSRVQHNRRDEIGQLGAAINEMAESLQRHIRRIREEESRLKSVLDTLISGVVMINTDKRIVLVNRHAEIMLGFTSKQLLGKSIYEANLQEELMQQVRECGENRQYTKNEIVFYYPEERVVEAHTVPMRLDEGQWGGFVIILHDITAIRRLERMRSEFVANVSHELKTPTASVQGFAETLLAGAIDDSETARSFVQIIYDESRRLNRLIGDILELSNIESRQGPLHFSAVHLPSFVSKMIELLSAAAVKKRIVISAEVPEELYIEADEDRLGQIFANLLSNGINYTPEGGKVTINVRPSNDGERIVITVEDTGIGIPEKDIPRIFERFYRVDKARSRSSGGTGLGLSIVKHLVELHQGTIQVESRSGIGTRFTLELPFIHEED